MLKARIEKNSAVQPDTQKTKKKLSQVGCQEENNNNKHI